MLALLKKHRTPIAVLLTISAVANFVWFCTLHSDSPTAIALMALMMLPLFAAGLMELVSRICDALESRIVPLLLAVLIPLAAGCSSTPDATPTPDEPSFPWQQRAMAEIAIVSVTSDATPGPRPGPKVGDKCSACNDPPGSCGVGRVGDGRVCDRCQTCGGDGRIDERDLTTSGDLITPPGLQVVFGAVDGWNLPGFVLPGEGTAGSDDPEPEPAEPETKSITLRMSYKAQAWGSDWWKESRQQFIDLGWDVNASIEKEGSLPAPFFEVRYGDRVEPIYEPLTVEILNKELERWKQ